jgi:O-acetyl-ADP-ribose deacetylase (regulator of RNase III)
MISYVTGDATTPTGTGCKIVCHVCNDQGFWGAGFVLALSARWPNVPAEYSTAFTKGVPHPEKLGTVQLVTIKDGELYVANMIAQRSIKPCKDYSKEGCPPIRYDALLKCLKEVATFAKQKNATIHAPRFGAGLSGGDWDVIAALIASAWADLQVTIYDFQAVQAAPQTDDEII